MIPFHGKDAAVGNRRRLLLISYYFPPDQTTGSLRWQKLARLADAHGWALDVVTLDPSCLTSADYRRLTDLPGDIRVFGVPKQPPLPHRLAAAAWHLWTRVRYSVTTKFRPRSDSHGDEEPAMASTVTQGSYARGELRWNLGSPRGMVRSYLAWYDHAQAGVWARRAARLSYAIIQSGVHRAVITSGPPHMSHEAGRLISKRTNLPHVMDMRDAWSLAQRLSEPIASPLWLWLARRHERRIVRRAAMVVTNTEPFREAMRAQYASVSGPIITVMNGTDDEPMPPSRHGEKFLVMYAGTVYLDRDPRPLFRAAARVIAALELTPADFGIQFFGDAARYGGCQVMDIARAEGLDRFVSVDPPKPRAELLDILATAALLVVLPQDSHLAIPAKLFEYMQLDAWILALATPDSATGALLRGTSAYVIEPGDVERIASSLRTCYEAYRSGERPMRIGAEQSFSRKSQAAILFGALDACLDGRACSDANSHRTGNVTADGQRDSAASTEHRRFRSGPARIATDHFGEHQRT